MAAILAQVEAILPQLITSLIVAGLSWLGSQILNRLKHRTSTTPQAAPGVYVPPGSFVPSTPLQPAVGVPVAPVWQARPAINWGQVVLHIGILQLVVNAVGLIVGSLVNIAAADGAIAPQSTTSTIILILLPVGTLTAIVVFLIFGLRVPKVIRWQHLTFVALGTVVLTLLVNSIFEQTLLFLNAAAVIFALIQTFVAMGIGGALAMLLGPREAAPAPVAQPAAPLPGTPPYGYGAWPGAPGYPPPPAANYWPAATSQSGGVPLQPPYPPPGTPPPGAYHPGMGQPPYGQRPPDERGSS